MPIKFTLSSASLTSNDTTQTILQKINLNSIDFIKILKNSRWKKSLKKNGENGMANAKNYTLANGKDSALQMTKYLLNTFEMLQKSFRLGKTRLPMALSLQWLKLAKSQFKKNFIHLRCWRFNCMIQEHILLKEKQKHKYKYSRNFYKQAWIFTRRNQN